MDKICATCKHWDNGPAAIWLPRNKSRKTCGSPIFYFGYGDDDDMPESALVKVENDEGWGMLTSPNFGCIGWEGKNDG